MYMYTSQTWGKYNALNTYVQVLTATGRTVKYKYIFFQIVLKYMYNVCFVSFKHSFKYKYHQYYILCFVLKI